MTIKRYAGDKFIGLSTDSKPDNVPDGAVFFESDTLSLYIIVKEEEIKSKGQENVNTKNDAV